MYMYLNTLKKIIAYTIALLAILLLAIQIPLINRKLTQGVVNLVSPKDMQIHIGRIRGTFPFDIVVDKVDIKDKAGAWLSIEDAAISWYGLDIIFGNVHFEHITAASVTWFRPPIGKTATSSSSDPIDIDLPNIAIDKLAISSLKLLPYYQASFGIKGRMDQRQAQVTLTNAEQELMTANMASTADEITLKVEAQESLHHLQTLFPELKPQIRNGVLNLTIDCKVGKKLDFVEGVIKGSVNDIITDNPTFKQFVDKKIEWSFPITTLANNNFIVQSGRLISDKDLLIQLNANVNRNLDDAKVDLMVKVPEIKNLMPLQWQHIKGPLLAQLSLHGTDNMANLAASLTMKNFIIANRPVSALTANLDLKDYKGNLNFNLNHPAFKAKLTTQVDVSEFTHLKLTHLNFSGLGGTLTGNCYVPLTDTYQTTADLSMAFKDITPIGNLGNLDLGGDLKLTVKLNSLADSLVDFKSQALKLNGIVLNNLLLHLQTTNGNGTFKASTHSPTLALQLAGKIEDHFQSTSIQTLNFSYNNTALITLPAPISFKNNEGDFLINAENIKIATGRLQITDLRLGSTLKGDIILKKVPVSFFNKFIEKIQLKGMIDGKVNIRGENSEPELTGELHAHEIGIINESRKNDKKSSLKLKFVKLNEQWSGDFSYQDSSSSHIKANIKAWDDSFFPGPQSHIDFSLNGRLNLSAINPYLWWGDRLKGTTTFDCHVGNSIAKPTLKGTITLKDGMYENSEFGTFLKDIQVKTALSNQQLRITQLQATDYNKGTVHGSGVIDFIDLSNPAPRIDLQLKKMVLANNDLITVSASGDMHLLTAPKKQILLKGELEVDSAEIILDDTVKNAKIIKIEDAHISQTEKLRKLNKRKAKKDSNFGLDLGINIPKTLVVQGYGIDSIWKGKLFVKDNINNPTVSGMIEVSKGKIDVVGKELVLKDSSIRFTKEDNEVVPLLNIKASKVIRDVEAFIRVEGKATHPNIDFVSVPSLSREEVVSLILFGKPLSSVSAAQSLQLATALASIKTGSGGKGFLEKLSSTFGLDDLGISSSSSSSSSDDHQEESTSGYALRAGKQLSDKIYVAVDQGVKDDVSTRIIMEIDATKNTKVNLEGGSRSNSVGYTWEKRY